MKRLERKLNVSDFNEEEILTAKEMRGVIGGIRQLTSLPHLCQATCHNTAIIRECNEGACYDQGPYALCIASGDAVLFSIGCDH